MSPNTFSDLTIVVVEDHDDARRYVGLFLDHVGANVLLARNAPEGFDAIKNNSPNLVLSDINMPGRCGGTLPKREAAAKNQGMLPGKAGQMEEAGN
jgi:CheY-like chemotaxis protein